MSKHLFEEDHDLLDPVLDKVEDNIQYGMDPLELLIHLEELRSLIETSMNEGKVVTFKRAPRPNATTQRS